MSWTVDGYREVLVDNRFLLAKVGRTGRKVPETLPHSENNNLAKWHLALTLLSTVRYRKKKMFISAPFQVTTADHLPLHIWFGMDFMLNSLPDATLPIYQGVHTVNNCQLSYLLHCQPSSSLAFTPTENLESPINVLSSYEEARVSREDLHRHGDRNERERTYIHTQIERHLADPSTLTLSLLVVKWLFLV